jgi:trigger factor
MDFQSSVVDIDEVTKQISVTVPKERVAKEYESSVTSVSRSAKINGFRPGKVPRHMVEKMMGDRIRFDVANRLINESLRGAFEEHKLEVVGEPEVDLKEIEPSKALEFTAKVALYPSPTISNYLNRQVQVTKKTVGDKEIADSLERLREAKAELKPIEDRKDAKNGDVVALSVSVSVDGGEFSRPEPFVDELGLGKLSKDVEAQVVGLTVNDSKEISTTAAADHANPEMAGKPLAHKVTLHGIFTKNMPELSDELVKATGLGVETVDALKEKIKEQLTQQATEDMKNEAQGAVLDLLVKEHSFKVPQVLVDDEIRGIVARYGFAGRDVNPQNIDITPFKAQFEEFALNRIRCAIIIDRIGSLEEIKVEESDRDKMIQRIAEQNGSTVEATRKAMLDKNRIMSFLLEVRRTKILDYLMEKTSVEYVDAPATTGKAA